MQNSNNSETSEQFKLIKSTYRGCWLLLHRNFVFQKNYENKDGSINWRSQNSRIKGQNKCSVTCPTINNVFIREPKLTEHNQRPKKKPRSKCTKACKISKTTC